MSKNYVEFKVNELREECKNRDLDSTGLKVHLVERLKKFDKDQELLIEAEKKAKELAEERAKELAEERAKELEAEKLNTKTIKDDNEEEKVTSSVDNCDNKSNEDTKSDISSYKLPTRDASIEKSPGKSIYELASSEPENWHNRTDVHLDFYNSDLNVFINDTGVSVKPFNKDGFQYMYASVKANQGVKTGKVFYEVKVIKRHSVEWTSEAGEMNQLRVGWSVSERESNLGQSNLSFGYDCNGKKKNENVLKDYGDGFQEGDTIQCCLEFVNNLCKISFCVNGKFHGEAYQISTSKLCDQLLIPHIITRNMSFDVNFGNDNNLPWFLPKTKITANEYNEDASWKIIGQLDKSQRTRNSEPPSSFSDCEVLMMCGLPGSGKTTWAEKMMKESTEKSYDLFSINKILEKMKMKEIRKSNNIKVRDSILQAATECLNKLMEIAPKRRRNYILDQTNVYPSAQRRRMIAFKSFLRKAVIIVPSDEEFQRRMSMAIKEEGKDIPERAMIQMKENFSIPDEKSDLFNEILFVELQRDETEKLIKRYNDEAKSNNKKSQYNDKKSSDNDGYGLWNAKSKNVDDAHEPPSKRSRWGNDSENNNSSKDQRSVSNSGGSKKHDYKGGFNMIRESEMSPKRSRSGERRKNSRDIKRRDDRNDSRRRPEKNDRYRDDRYRNDRSHDSRSRGGYSVRSRDDSKMTEFRHTSRDRHSNDYERKSGGLLPLGVVKDRNRTPNMGYNNDFSHPPTSNYVQPLMRENRINEFAPSKFDLFGQSKSLQRQPHSEFIDYTKPNMSQIREHPGMTGVSQYTAPYSKQHIETDDYYTYNSSDTKDTRSLMTGEQTRGRGSMSRGQLKGSYEFNRGNRGGFDSSRDLNRGNRGGFDELRDSNRGRGSFRGRGVDFRGGSTSHREQTTYVDAYGSGVNPARSVYDTVNYPYSDVNECIKSDVSPMQYPGLSNSNRAGGIALKKGFEYKQSDTFGYGRGGYGTNVRSGFDSSATSDIKRGRGGGMGKPSFDTNNYQSYSDRTSNVAPTKVYESTEYGSNVNKIENIVEPRSSMDSVGYSGYPSRGGAGVALRGGLDNSTGYRENPSNINMSNVSARGVSEPNRGFYNNRGSSIPIKGNLTGISPSTRGTSNVPRGMNFSGYASNQSIGTAPKIQGGNRGGFARGGSLGVSSRIDNNTSSMGNNGAQTYTKPMEYTYPAIPSLNNTTSSFDKRGSLNPRFDNPASNTTIDYPKSRGTSRFADVPVMASVDPRSVMPNSSFNMPTGSQKSLNEATNQDYSFNTQSYYDNYYSTMSSSVSSSTAPKINSANTTVMKNPKSSSQLYSNPYESIYTTAGSTSNYNQPSKSNSQGQVTSSIPGYNISMPPPNVGNSSGPQQLSTTNPYFSGPYSSISNLANTITSSASQVQYDYSQYYNQQYGNYGKGY